MQRDTALREEAFRQWQEGAITYCELVARIVELLTFEDIEEHNKMVPEAQQWPKCKHYLVCGTQK